MKFSTGDKVTIMFDNGNVIRGTVTKATHYQGLGDCLEIARENRQGKSWGQCRWKEWIHGGTAVRT